MDNNQTRSLTPFELAPARLVDFHLNLAAAMDCMEFISAMKVCENDKLQTTMLELSWVKFMGEAGQAWN